MRREDWTLLVLAAADGELLSYSQLMKCAYLIVRASKAEGDRPEFKAGPYGPTQEELCADIKLLEERGLAFSFYRDRVSMYAASVAGWKLAATLPVSEKDQAYARQVMEWSKTLDFNGLWVSMRKSHPEMCTGLM